MDDYKVIGDVWEDVDGLRFKLLKLRESSKTETVSMTKELFNQLIKHADEILVKLDSLEENVD